MTTVTVKLNRLRMAPRKVRLVIDLVRGLKVAAAKAQLAALPNRAAQAVAKLLKSAEAAAKDRGLATESLWISRVVCDQGPALKRRQISSRGRASLIKKFYSHVTLSVSDEAPKGRAQRRQSKAQSSENNLRSKSQA